MFINIVLLDNVYQRKIVSESAGIVDEFDCERTCMRRCLAVVESARSPRSKAVQCFKGVQRGRKQSKAVQRSPTVGLHGPKETLAANGSVANDCW